MPQGYSLYTIEANRSADRRLLGVALGRVCIAKDVPVSTVAKRFKVSRQTIYNWFIGKYVPQLELTRPIRQYIEALSKD